MLLFNVSHTETWIRFWVTKQSNICKLQAEAAAREAEASSREHLEDLLARMEARERWLAGERETLDVKIREATAPSTAGRDKHLQAAEALRSKVDTLRYILHCSHGSKTNHPLSFSASEHTI